MNHQGLARIIAPVGLDMREAPLNELPEDGLNTAGVTQCANSVQAQTTATDSATATATATEAPATAPSEVLAPVSTISIDTRSHGTDQTSVATTQRGGRGISKAFILEHGAEANIHETYEGVPRGGARNTQKLGSGGTAQVCGAHSMCTQRSLKRALCNAG